MVRFSLGPRFEGEVEFKFLLTVLGFFGVLLNVLRFELVSKQMTYFDDLDLVEGRYRWRESILSVSSVRLWGDLKFEVKRTLYRLDHKSEKLLVQLVVLPKRTFSVRLVSFK